MHTFFSVLVYIESFGAIQESLSQTSRQQTNQTKPALSDGNHQKNKETKQNKKQKQVFLLQVRIEKKRLPSFLDFYWDWVICFDVELKGR